MYNKKLSAVILSWTQVIFDCGFKIMKVQASS